MQTWNKVIISMEAATEVVNFETAGARKSVLIRQDHIVHRRKMHYFLESPLLYSRQPYTDMIYPYLRFKAEFRCFYSSFPFVFPKICFYFKKSRNFTSVCHRFWVFHVLALSGIVKFGRKELYCLMIILYAHICSYCMYLCIRNT